MPAILKSSCFGPPKQAMQVYSSPRGPQLIHTSLCNSYSHLHFSLSKEGCCLCLKLLPKSLSEQYIPKALTRSWLLNVMQFYVLGAVPTFQNFFLLALTHSNKCPKAASLTLFPFYLYLLFFFILC